MKKHLFILSTIIIVLQITSTQTFAQKADVEIAAINNPTATPVQATPTQTVNTTPAPKPTTQPTVVQATPIPTTSVTAPTAAAQPTAQPSNTNTVANVVASPEPTSTPTPTSKPKPFAVAVIKPKTPIKTNSSPLTNITNFLSVPFGLSSGAVSGNFYQNGGLPNRTNILLLALANLLIFSGILLSIDPIIYRYVYGKFSSLFNRNASEKRYYVYSEGI